MGDDEGDAVDIRSRLALTEGWTENRPRLKGSCNVRQTSLTANARERISLFVFSGSRAHLQVRKGVTELIRRTTV